MCTGDTRWIQSLSKRQLSFAESMRSDGEYGDGKCGGEESSATASTFMQTAIKSKIRVGDSYQAIIRSHSKSDLNDDRYSGELLWRPKVSSDKAVGDFLNELRQRFPLKMDIDEEAALTLLQTCQHDKSAALKLADLPKCTRRSKYFASNNRLSELVDGEEHCLICKTGGTVLLCDVPGCSRLYHPSCIGLDGVPSGKWRCPRHTCAFCSEINLPLQCKTCWISYCSKHAPFGRDSDEFECINCSKQYEEERKMFLEELESIHMNEKKLSNRKCKLIVQSKPVDLWALYHSVASLGGYEKISSTQWSLIFRHLGYRLSFRETSSENLVDIYHHKLLPYASSRLNNIEVNNS